MKLILITIIFSLVCIVSATQISFAETMQIDPTDAFVGGTISGRLLRANGRVRAYTEMELVPVGDKKKSSDMRLWAISNSGGYFAFKNVPKGSYTLSVNFNEKPTETSPFSTAYYPKTQFRSEAKVFAVLDKSRFSRLSFKLPPKLKTRTITGKITWEDGSPVKDAFITIIDIEIDIFLSFRVKTNAEGFFSTKAYMSRKYSVVAMLLDSATIDAYSEPTARGQTRPFILDAETKPVKIVMKQLNKPKTNLLKDGGIIGNLETFKLILEPKKMNLRVLEIIVSLK